MASKCPQCGSEQVTVLQPRQRHHETGERENSINDAQETLLVCGKCGYLGAQASAPEVPSEYISD